MVGRGHAGTEPPYRKTRVLTPPSAFGKKLHFLLNRVGQVNGCNIAENSSKLERQESFPELALSGKSEESEGIVNRAWKEGFRGSCSRTLPSETGRCP